MKFYYRPLFIFWINLLLSLFPALVFSVITCVIAKVMLPPGTNSLVISCIGLGALGAFTLLIYTARACNHAYTEYRFFDDRIEYRQTFLTYTTKVFKYRDIVKLEMNQDILMKPFHMGSIFITMKQGKGDNVPTIGTMLGLRSVTRNGLIIRNVENPKFACKRIAEIAGF